MGKQYIDFVAVKSAVPITQVLERYGLLGQMRSIRNGDGYEGRCPIHQGTSEDQFKVSVSKNCWNCFGDCKGGGNGLDFVVRMENISAHEAAHRLNEWFGLKLDQVASPPHNGSRQHGGSKPRTDSAAQPSAERSSQISPAPASEEPRPEPTGTNDPLKFELTGLRTDHPYFAERGLTPEAVAHFGLGFCSKGTMSGRVVIPIHNVEGALVGYAGRWPGAPDSERPKYKLPKDFLKSAEVFNLHRALKEDASLPLIVTEGFFEVTTLWQYGWRRVVSIMGSHLSARQEQLLLISAQANRRIILLFDEDDAGRNGRAKALQSLAAHAFVKVAMLPREGAQPDHLTAEELSALLS